MKTKLMIVAVVVLVAFTAFTSKEISGNYTADTEKSTIAWRGEKVTGEHNGHIKLKSASLEIKKGELVGGNFVVDMTSLTNEDLKDESYNKKLVGHLKSDDFFGVENHPTSKFVIKNVKSEGEGKYNVKGDITIKGITKPIEFPATLSIDGNNVVANAKVVIDRSEFDVRYGSKSFFDNLGDKMIYDEFELDVSIVAAQ